MIRRLSLFLAVCVMLDAWSWPVQAQTSRPAADFVRPVPLAQLRERLKALPDEHRELVSLYLQSAARDVLKLEDGCCPVKKHTEYYRNLGERAKGAAVLASLNPPWPAELVTRCRTQAREFVRDVALSHRAKPNLDYEWQAAFWVGEAAIAGWFLWDDLDADLRNAVAEMVIFQADRFIDVKPNTAYQGGTEAETVSWNSSILTLAVNMMPHHPHLAKWDEAAKRYLYNIFSVPQDAEDASPGDDGRAIREWVVGPNLYPDFALENHRQFHIDYVLASYRFHAQGAWLYWLTGRPLPKAFGHHAREVYERILLPCMTADGFFAYVSDNDWKRYHCWAESSLVHAYLATTQDLPEAVALEQRAIRNAVKCWKAFPEGFAYDNPYVCGRPWTTRLADAVMLHLSCPQTLPGPMSDASLNKKIVGTSRLGTADLLTHLTVDGSYRSVCRGKYDAWVRYVAPREAWGVLPEGGNYEPRIDDKPVIGPAKPVWQRSDDWFWMVRQDEQGRAEAFVSLPGPLAACLYHLPASRVPQSGEVISGIAIEKPFGPMSIYFEGGRASFAPGKSEWEYSEGVSGPRGTWFNLQDQIGWATCAAEGAALPVIRLPKAGTRGRLSVVSSLGGGTVTSAILVLPNQDHAATARVASQFRCRSDGDRQVLSCRTGEYEIFVNLGGQEVTVESSMVIKSRSVICLKDGKKVF